MNQNQGMLNLPSIPLNQSLPLQNSLRLQQFQLYMKFNHSERTLHQEPHYTPASNYYNIAKNEQKVLTGSLMGPSIPKQQPNFGLSTRFSLKKQKVPGPGAYLEDRVQQQPKKYVKTSAVIRQYKKHGFLGGEERNPSIPYTNFNPDQEDKEYIRQIMMNEDLNQSDLSTKKKNEGHTFSKSPRQINQNSPQKCVVEPELERIVEYSEKMRFMGVKYKIEANKEQIKKSNERRAEIINMMNPEFVPSLELIEIITKRKTKYTPGPGFYNQEDIRHNENGAIFSTSRRFSEDHGSATGPGRYQVKEEKKKSISFSKSARTLFNMKGDTDLEHRFYIDPYSNIKRRDDLNLKGKNEVFSFGSQVVRFNKLEKELPHPETSKQNKKSKIQSVIEMRLQKMHAMDKRHTAESEGLLGIQTMASTID